MEKDQHRAVTDKSIIAVGSPIIDTLAQVDEAYLKTISGAKGGMELVDGDTMQALLGSLDGQTVRAPGGSAGNTAFALAHLGAQVGFIGKIGDDEAGEYYRARFKNLGGDISRFKVGTIPSGRCLSLITPDSERTMRTDLGAAMTLAPHEISAADFIGYDHAHIEGYLLFNEALLMQVLQCARSAGCTVSLDLASFEVVQAASNILPGILRDYVDIVFANEEEAAAFCGGEKQFVEMARELAGFCEIAAVKLGKDGALVCRGDTVHRINAAAVASVVDTTGAGDFWATGFLWGWARGQSLTVCGQCGSVLGAEVVQVVGARLPQDTWVRVKEALANLSTGSDQLRLERA